MKDRECEHSRSAAHHTSVLGVGETSYSKSSEISTLEYMVEACRRAVFDSDLKPSDVDGLAVSSYSWHRECAATLAEHLGLELNWIHDGACGGASPIVSMIEASRAIDAGAASKVICVAGDSLGKPRPEQLLRGIAPSVDSFTANFGSAGPTGLFALIQDEFMRVSGSTRTATGRVAVAQRYNASSNDNALFREVISLNDYFASRMIVEPLCLLDCVYPCSGANAVVVGQSLGRRSVQDVPILASAQVHNRLPGSMIPIRHVWTSVAERIYKATGLTAADIDLWQMYDDYPITVLIQLVDFGLINERTLSEKTPDLDLSIEGQPPYLNSHGGQLSAGQPGAAGGLAGVVEAVRQLRGCAGSRQVAECRRALATGYGVVAYGRGLSTACILLGTGD